MPDQQQTKIVLLIDDDPAIHFAFQKVLVKENYRTISLFQCNEAVAAVKTKNPHMVIINLKALGKTEATLVQQLKQLRPDLPVVIMTAFTNEITSKKCRAIGADDYLEKPFEIQQMLQKIELLLKKI